MAAVNIVLNGWKEWILIAEKDYRKLESVLQMQITGQDLFLSEDRLKALQIPYEKVRVEAGQGIFVPSGVLHAVRNGPETIAVAFNVILPEIAGSVWDVFTTNRLLGSVLKQDVSKVRLQELYVRLGCHLLLESEVAKKLQQILSNKRFNDLKLVLLRIVKEIRMMEDITVVGGHPLLLDEKRYPQVSH